MEGVGGGNLQKTSSASSRKCLRMKNQPHNLMSKLKTVQITKEPEKRATIELNTRILEIVALPCVVRNINCLNQDQIVLVNYLLQDVGTSKRRKIVHTPFLKPVLA